MQAAPPSVNTLILVLQNNYFQRQKMIRESEDTL